MECFKIPPMACQLQSLETTPGPCAAHAPKARTIWEEGNCGVRRLQGNRPMGLGTPKGWLQRSYSVPEVTEPGDGGAP